MVSIVCEGEEVRLILIETNSPLTMIVPSFFLKPWLVSTGTDSSSAMANTTIEPTLWRLGTQVLIKVEI